MQDNDGDTLLQGRSRSWFQIVEGNGKLDLGFGVVLAELDRFSLIPKVRESVDQSFQKSKICFFAPKL